MTLLDASSSGHWIIGYGNSQRRDDGIGSYIVSRLQPLFGYRSDVHLLISHQLEPDMIDDLKNAATLLFVDATIKRVMAGRRWSAVHPELKTMPCPGHGVTPAVILGWLQWLYRRCPPAWLICVEGDDFRLGSGLSSGAQKRADQVVGEITGFVRTQVDRTGTELSDKPAKGISDGQDKDRRPT